MVTQLGKTRQPTRRKVAAKIEKRRAEKSEESGQKSKRKEGGKGGETMIKKRSR